MFSKNILPLKLDFRCIQLFNDLFEKINDIIPLINFL